MIYFFFVCLTFRALSSLIKNNKKKISDGFLKKKNTITDSI